MEGRELGREGWSGLSWGGGERDDGNGWDGEGERG